MNNNIYISNGWRFVLLFLLQTMILKRIELPVTEVYYISLLVYPLFIMLLPIKTPKFLALILGMALGLLIDGFYNTPGVHAGALVFTAYIRPFILKVLEPFEGYNIDTSPTLRVMGFSWFLTYSSILLFLHCIIYFSLEAFSLVYWLDILILSVLSFFPSIVIVLLFQLISRSKT